MSHEKIVDAVETGLITIFGVTYSITSILQGINMLIGTLVGLATLLLTILKILQLIGGDDIDGKTMSGRMLNWLKSKKWQKNELKYVRIFIWMKLSHHHFMNWVLRFWKKSMKGF